MQSELGMIQPMDLLQEERSSPEDNLHKRVLGAFVKTCNMFSCRVADVTSSLFDSLKEATVEMDRILESLLHAVIVAFPLLLVLSFSRIEQQQGNVTLGSQAERPDR
mmetsp:Transcript_5873/g.13050  ORF Transcript_5873/g.13050 Transcript_5873/m.13050 type:complete len:107 (-) Transcript_5873:2231-2551(-)